MNGLHVLPLQAIASVQPGDNLSTLLLNSLQAHNTSLQPNDVVVLAQKIVSKAEGRQRQLSAVRVSAEAQALAAKTDKDPRLVQLILEESTDVIRAVPGVLIVRHRHGHVMANAGIDASNLDGDDDQVLLLPEDSDASAARLRAQLLAATGAVAPVVIADSFGRPWRNGVTNVAIGAAGLPALLDKRRETDRAGRTMKVTQVAVADLLACAAGLVMGEGREGIPAVVIRGLSADYLGCEQGSGANHCNTRAIVRPLDQDLFR